MQVKFEKQRVLDACFKYREFRAARIHDKTEQLIESCMKPRFFGLLRPRTRAEAEAFVESEMQDELRYYEIYAGAEYQKILAIECASRFSSEEFVYLETDEVQVLGWFLVDDNKLPS